MTDRQTDIALLLPLFNSREKFINKPEISPFLANYRYNLLNMLNLCQRILVGQRTRSEMKQIASLRLVFLALVGLMPLCIHSRPTEMDQKLQERTAALPLLLLLAYPSAVQQVGGSALLPGIPIRRPQDELSSQADEPAPPMKVQSDEPSMDKNAVIREQFIQGVLQGLQSMAAQGGPTVQPAVLADFLAQVNAARTTIAPSITPPPTVEKDAQLVNNDHDADYDYIDFNNGSRIKYDLDSNDQTSDSQYPNKILQPVAEEVSPAAASAAAAPHVLSPYLVLSR